ncbi:MAG: hypothetical protein VYD77_04150 [Actinomycetota bacterium]|nr:hypothetical protein [Actinomycetota bacterium]
MIKKILWMTAGFGAGISSSLWVKHLVRRRVEQYSGSVSNNFLSNRIETTKTTLKNARSEGKKVVLKYQDRLSADQNSKKVDTFLMVNE